MNFEIEGKVAIVTGGVSGIGLSLVKDLLRNGAKGITIADVNSTLGEEIVRTLGEEFGPSRVIFVKTDVSNRQQFENAFKNTVEEFRFVDILINNAGVTNWPCWETEIKINVNGVICGILLGLENYLQQNRQGSEAVIVNIASTAGFMPHPMEPVYGATKFAVVGASMSWGSTCHYERTNVKVLTVCPNLTYTLLALDNNKMHLGDAYSKLFQSMLQNVPPSTWQAPKDVARETMRVIRKAKSGTVWVVEHGKPAYEFIFPDIQSMKNNTL